ncbi:MAG: hypothetical protein AAF492_32190, partial [Verrucomicrobiota bacterium]
RAGIFFGAGAVYLFHLDGSMLLAITNPAPDTNDRFGSSVAALGDNGIIVGSPADNGDRGSVWLFDTNGTLLLDLPNPSPATFESFGQTVEGYNDELFLVGAPNYNGGAIGAGRVYLFNTNGTIFRSAFNPAPDMFESFGTSFAVVNGRIAVGTPDDEPGGTVYLYDTDFNLLATMNNPSPEMNDQFGGRMAALDDDRILIGASGKDVAGHEDAGAAYIFNTNGSHWATILNPLPLGSDGFGISVAAGNGRFVVGAFRDSAMGVANAGAAHLYSSVVLHSRTITNVVTVSTMNQADPVPADNRAEAVFTVGTGFELVQTSSIPGIVNTTSLWAGGTFAQTVTAPAMDAQTNR